MKIRSIPFQLDKLKHRLPDSIDVVVQLVPKLAQLCVDQEEGVKSKRDENLAHDLYAESTDGQQPGGYSIRVP